MNWFEAYLDRSLADERLSRSESKGLKVLLKEHAPDDDKVAQLRALTFDYLERNQQLDGNEKLAAAERVVKTLAAYTATQHPSQSDVETLFFPAKASHDRLLNLVGNIRKRADICVFTITDDRVVNKLIALSDKGIRIRVISDNDKSLDRGSDIERMAKAGIAVALDESEHHMHHKFALFDDRLALTGSYNWTRSAANHNRENLLITDDVRVFADFRKEFDRLWKTFSGR